MIAIFSHREIFRGEKFWNTSRGRGEVRFRRKQMAFADVYAGSEFDAADAPAKIVAHLDLVVAGKTILLAGPPTSEARLIRFKTERDGLRQYKDGDLEFLPQSFEGEFEIEGRITDEAKQYLSAGLDVDLSYQTSHRRARYKRCTVVFSGCAFEGIDFETVGKQTIKFTASRFTAWLDY